MTDIDWRWRVAQLAFVLVILLLTAATVIQLILERDVMACKRLYRMLTKQKSHSRLGVQRSVTRNHPETVMSPDDVPAGARRASDVEVGAMVSSARAYDADILPQVNVISGIRLDPPPHRMYVGKVHRVLHRVVAVAVLCQLVRALDPHGVLGIHDWISLTAVANLVAVLLIVGASAFLYITIETSYRLLHRRPPTFLRDVLIANACVSFVVALVTVALSAVTKDTFVTLGVFLLWMSVAEIVVMVFFHIGVKGMEMVRDRFKAVDQRLSTASSGLRKMSSRRSLLGTEIKAGDEEEDTATTSTGEVSQDHDDLDIRAPPRRMSTIMAGGKAVKESTIDRAIMRLKLTRRYATVIVAVAICFQVVVALGMIGQDREEADPAEFDWSAIVFAWIHTLVIILILWYTWLPTCYLGAHKPLARELAELTREG